MLNDGNPDVRQSVAYALGDIGAPAASAVLALIRALKYTHLEANRSAWVALGGIGPPAVPALVRALSSADPRVFA
jgi:HEAT repeat protein